MTGSGAPVVTPAVARWMASYVESLFDIAIGIMRIGLRVGLFPPDLLRQAESVHAAARTIRESVGLPLAAACPRCRDPLGFLAMNRQSETRYGRCPRCRVAFNVTVLGRVTGMLVDASPAVLERMISSADHDHVPRRAFGDSASPGGM